MNFILTTCYYFAIWLVWIAIGFCSHLFLQRFSTSNWNAFDALAMVAYGSPRMQFWFFLVVLTFWPIPYIGLLLCAYGYEFFRDRVYGTLLRLKHRKAKVIKNDPMEVFDPFVQQEPKRKNFFIDPVKHCVTYQESGCAHVDGFLCEPEKCGGFKKNVLKEKKE